MTAVIVITVLLLVAASCLAAWRVLKGPDDASRAIVGDLFFFCAIAIFIVTAASRPTAVLFDVVLLASLSGLLATIALARLLTRGQR